MYGVSLRAEELRGKVAGYYIDRVITAKKTIDDMSLTIYDPPETGDNYLAFAEQLSTAEDAYSTYRGVRDRFDQQRSSAEAMQQAAQAEIDTLSTGEPSFDIESHNAHTVRYQAYAQELSRRQGIDSQLRALQGAAHSPGIRELAGTIAAGTVSQGSSPNIQGTASATPSAGAAGAGIAGVGNRASMGMGDKQIWSGEMEQQRGGAYGQQKKGESMKLGEQLLKETKDKMNAKGGSKKPAHGVLVIIGTNAGPGPIKDGKRVKKD